MLRLLDRHLSIVVGLVQLGEGLRAGLGVLAEAPADRDPFLDELGSLRRQIELSLDVAPGVPVLEIGREHGAEAGDDDAAQRDHGRNDHFACYATC